MKSKHSFAGCLTRDIILDELAATGADNPEMLVARMTGAVRAFAGEAEQSDDQTMLAGRFNGTE